MILAHSIPTWELLLISFLLLPLGFPLFRSFVFFFELLFQESLPRGFYVFMAWSGRLILLASALLMLSGGIYEVIRNGIPSGDRSWEPWGMGSFPLLYVPAMLILNFPKFPLKWNVRLFPVAQLFLLPPFLSIIFLISMGTDNKGGIFLIYLLFMLANAALWWLCLRDRAKAEA